MDICRHSFPDEVATTTGGAVACHLHTSGPQLGGRPLDEFSGSALVTASRHSAEEAPQWWLINRRPTIRSTAFPAPSAGRSPTRQV